MNDAAVITAIGTYVPERVLANAELERMVETSDEWIVQRTGIRERRIAAAGEFTSDMCASAIRNMLERYDRSVEDADLIIVCTHTPDLPFPNVSARLQAEFRIHSAGAVDLNAACAGFVYGLHMANGLISAGLHRKVLVVGADSMSKITDYTDRSTCILFGDGAGAVLVEGTPGGNSAFLGHHLQTNGEGGQHVYRSGLADKLRGMPLTANGFFVQNGREVYKWAVGTIPGGMRQTAANSGLELDRIDWFVPHSANLRIIESVCEKSGFPLERVIHSTEFCGNTSAASIPLSLDKGISDDKIKTGDTILLYGFGAGLTQAGLVIRWTL